MSFVVAKCTECGSIIEVDDSKEAGICRHCGTAFVTQKVVNNHNTYVTQNVTKHIYGKEKTEAAEYLSRGETFLKLKDWISATDAYEEAAEAAPHDYRCWLGLIRSETKNLTDLDDTFHVEHYRKALAVANDAEKKGIKDLCENYVRLSSEHRKEQEALKNEQREKVNESRKEKEKLQKRSHKQFTISLIIFAISIFSAAIIFPLSFIINWKIAVPLGVTFLIISAIFCVLTVISSRKNQKLLNEIEELNKQIRSENTDLNNIFKNFDIFK